VRLDAVIEHLYVTSVELLRAKVSRYALLWALRHQAEGRKRLRSPAAQWALHMVRDLLLRGAVFSGRTESFQIAAVLAEYHACKYALLREVRTGRYHGLATLLAEDRLEELFQAMPAHVESDPVPWLTRLGNHPRERE